MQRDEKPLLLLELQESAECRKRITNFMGYPSRKLANCSQFFRASQQFFNPVTFGHIPGDMYKRLRTAIFITNNGGTYANLNNRSVPLESECLYRRQNSSILKLLQSRFFLLLRCSRHQIRHLD
ncbi:hypothetical protein D3C75_864390 [compost metagenome]